MVPAAYVNRASPLSWDFIGFLCKSRNISFYSFLSHSFIHSFANAVSPEGSPGSCGCWTPAQEAGQVVWYSHLFQNFPVYCDPHSQRLWHSHGELLYYIGILSHGTFKHPDFQLSLSCSASLCAKSLQLCLTLYKPMNCSPPGSSDHGILLARILKWISISSSRGSSQLGDKNHISYI